MPQLNRDLLREVFYETIKNRNFQNIEKFMMAGKEPFQLVLDLCMNAVDVELDNFGFAAHLPNDQYMSLMIGKDEKPGNVLYKPISIALASSLTTLRIGGFSPALIPMFKSIDQEMDEVFICAYDKQYKAIFEACTNISFVRGGVTVKNDYAHYLIGAMKFFAIPCHKLTIYDNNIYFFNKKMDLKNSHLHNIRDFAIKCTFVKRQKYLRDVKKRVTFLSINFPNLETFNADIDVLNSNWNWNDERMANLLKALPSGVKGLITFKIQKYKLFEGDQNEYPNVQRNGNEYYQIYPVTDNFSLKLITVSR